MKSLLLLGNHFLIYLLFFNKADFQLNASILAATERKWRKKNWLDHRERVIDHKEGLRLHLLLPSESKEEEKDQARVKIRSHGELGRRKKTVGLWSQGYEARSTGLTSKPGNRWEVHQRSDMNWNPLRNSVNTQIDSQSHSKIYATGQGG